jgi:TetR/AcrR family transcriptional regulator
MGIMERREREKEQRRNDILDAAEKVFFNKGINLATMDDVAEAAELSKGTLYLYFKSKEEIFTAITCRALTLLKTMFEKAVSQHKTGIEKVRAIGEAYYHYSQKYSDYFHMILHYESSQLDQSAQQAFLQECHRYGQEVTMVVADAVASGVNDGSMRPDLDPVRTAFLLQGLSTGIIQLIAREKVHIKELKMFDAENLMDDFTEMMYHAMHKNG